MNWATLSHLEKAQAVNWKNGSRKNCLKSRMTLKMRQQVSCSFCFFWSPPSLSVRSVPHPLGGWMRLRRTSTTWWSPPWTWPDHHHTSWIPSSCSSCSAPRLSHRRPPPQQGDLVQDISIDIDIDLQEKRKKARQLNKQPGYKDKQVIITKRIQSGMILWSAKLVKKSSSSWMVVCLFLQKLSSLVSIFL